ncbi:ATP-dependent helicase HrpB [Rosenbergiella nectarea]|uniref:ATP-dependent helicase HrpB n=1 Tax=Rosenbergiella nectarea TaxID=988801 RepID=UPI001BD9E92F|nr:ATP-dependent helicase HrpB [Rosenbergiella nectarea]MBT0729028.1 ATP-dependent helicase HrpB [Rosenbergiella nectarea subsp. apis]
MSTLPIHDVLDELVLALSHSPQVILQAPPGAGKSTWLPIQLLQRLPLNGKIIMLEPRRLAAKNVAFRLAHYLGEPPGETVGYRMRAEQCIGKTTRLEVVTEGVLTRRLQQDPMLEDVSLVIIDEFHERSLQADLALAFMLDIQKGLRDDLKLLIMSATLDNRRLGEVLTQAPTITSEGRHFPVQRFYHGISSQGVFSVNLANKILEVLRHEQGDMLVFLPGEREIHQVISEVAARCPAGVELRPLYGALSIEQQQQAITISATGQRKVVFATNIAETSLTIEGISLIIDSVLERVSLFDLRAGAHRLKTQYVSESSMTQRAGRAGRLMPGKCWHLITTEQAERLAEQAPPEILRSDLTGLLLNVLAWGCQHVTALQWLDEPSQPALAYATAQLRQLAAIDATGALTPKGRKMAELGVAPRLAAMLIASESINNSESTAAMLTAIIEQPERRGEGDLRDNLSAPSAGWNTRARQVCRMLRVNFTPSHPDKVLPLLLAAFADRIAYRRGATHRYQLADGRGATLGLDHPLTRYTWLIAVQLQLPADRHEAHIQLAFPFSLDDIRREAPQLITQRHALEWDESQAQFKVWQHDVIGEIIVSSRPGEKPNPEQLIAAYLVWIKDKGLAALPWDKPALELRERLGFAQQWLPELGWPSVTDTDLMDNLEGWLGPELAHLPSLGNFSRINLYEALKAQLSWEQWKYLETEVPTHITVPTGRKVAIDYLSPRAPLLSIKVQEMYGQQRPLTLARGRVNVVIELLSPAQRPIQITQDLAGFWQGSWREVQKEMKGRYPKHLWPDDPANTLPTTRTRKSST